MNESPQVRTRGNPTAQLNSNVDKQLVAELDELCITHKLIKKDVIELGIKLAINKIKKDKKQ